MALRNSWRILTVEKNNNRRSQTKRKRTLNNIINLVQDLKQHTFP